MARRAKPADKRTAKETDELFDWWLSAEDKPTQELVGRLTGLEQEEQVDEDAAAPSLT